MHVLEHIYISLFHKGGAVLLCMQSIIFLAIVVYTVYSCQPIFLPLNGMQVQARESASVVTTAGVTRAAVSALSVVS